MATLGRFIDDRGVNTSFSGSSWCRRVKRLFADFLCRFQSLLEFDTLLSELVLHGFSLTLLCLLLLGHITLEFLVLLRQLHVLLHGLVEELELAVEVTGTLWAQASLLGRAFHLLVIDRQICDNLLDTLLLRGSVVGLRGE